MTETRLAIFLCPSDTPPTLDVVRVKGESFAGVRQRLSSLVRHHRQIGGR